MTYLDLINVGTVALLRGGKHIVNLFGKSMEELGTEYKPEDGDSPRTLIDTHSEKEIMRVLEHSQFRDDSFNPEESGAIQGSTGRTWHIDPYDGTSNAAIQSPNSTSGLAVQEGDELVAAVVLHPFEGKLYWASKDEGAYVCDVAMERGQFIKTSQPKQIRVSPEEEVKKMYALVDSFMNVNTAERKTGWMKDIASVAMHLRSTGSNIDYGVKLAEGRGHISLTDAVGGFFDVAPGFVLVTEAGGCYGNLTGEQPKPGDEVTIGASNRELFERVLEITNQHYGPESPLGMYQGFR